MTFIISHVLNYFSRLCKIVKSLCITGFQNHARNNKRDRFNKLQHKLVQFFNLTQTMIAVVLLFTKQKWLQWIFFLYDTDAPNCLKLHLFPIWSVSKLHKKFAALSGKKSIKSCVWRCLVESEC